MGISRVINKSIDSDHCNVIIEIAGVKIWMNEYLCRVEFNMRIKFGIVVDIPLAQTNSEILILRA